jgi:hypothetical protein
MPEAGRIGYGVLRSARGSGKLAGVEQWQQQRHQRRHAQREIIDGLIEGPLHCGHAF